MRHRPVFYGNLNNFVFQAYYLYCTTFIVYFSPFHFFLNDPWSKKSQYGIFPGSDLNKKKKNQQKKTHTQPF